MGRTDGNRCRAENSVTGPQSHELRTAPPEEQPPSRRPRKPQPGASHFLPATLRPHCMPQAPRSCGVCHLVPATNKRRGTSMNVRFEGRRGPREARESWATARVSHPAHAVWDTAALSAELRTETADLQVFLAKQAGLVLYPLKRVGSLPERPSASLPCERRIGGQRGKGDLERRAGGVGLRAALLLRRRGPAGRRRRPVPLRGRCDPDRADGRRHVHRSRRDPADVHGLLRELGRDGPRHHERRRRRRRAASGDGATRDVDQRRDGHADVQLQLLHHQRRWPVRSGHHLDGREQPSE